ncbi:hypothetical protein ANANG_G00290340 [Anguilla anguilla]|uniref:Uncharacterized protein n=1 Tax=Anguilla anguilla TaxID=7936 RepID=A0A9D3LTD5_ANGAN|nr:hypothetical protein ANANG_G00290340 [Anguilla anguilla]
MSSFGKLTDYFIRRKSQEDLRGARRESQRSSSYCCTVAEARSLEKKLQRPLLAKSRTLPSIPQSPMANRMNRSDLVDGSQAHVPFRFKPLLAPVSLRCPQQVRLSFWERGWSSVEGCGPVPSLPCPTSGSGPRTCRRASPWTSAWVARSPRPAGGGADLPQQQGQAQKEICESRFLFSPLTSSQSSSVFFILRR